MSSQTVLGTGQAASSASATKNLVSEEEITRAAAASVLFHKRLVLGLQLGIFIAFLAAWEIGVRAGAIDPFFYSSPSAIASRLYEWVTEGTVAGSLWYQLYVTMEEAVLGFLTGSIMGVICGIFLGRNKLASDVLDVYIKVLNAIPRVVLAPIFILLFGLGLTSKVALSFVMVFFVVFANAFQGVREADRAMIANAQILGASQWQVTRYVVLPSAMSWIFASLHVSFGFAIVGAIVGEYVGARYGIGLLIQTAAGSFDAAGIFGAIVLIVIIALSAEYIMTALENYLVRWRPPQVHEG